MAKRKIDLASLPTLESMLSRIERLSVGVSSFELLVADRMTLHGRLICGTFPEAAVLNRLLQKGLVPVGGERKGDGKLFKFGRQRSPDPSALRTEPPPIDIAEGVPALAPLAK